MADYRLRIIVEGEDRASGPLGNVAGSLQRIGEFATGGVLTKGITSGMSALRNLTGEALDAYANYERLGMALETLVARELMNTGAAETMNEALGMSTERAEELLGWVEDLAVKSPFTQQGIAQAFRTTMAYGFVTDEAMRLTQVMVDFAAGSGATDESMSRIALALGQIKARGKLAGQEIMQLTEAGIPVRQILAKSLNVTTAELEKMIEKGLSADIAINAIVGTLERDFAGAAERQAGTFSGLLSSLEDLREIGLRDFFGPMFQAVQPQAEALVNTLTDPAVKAQITEWGTAAGDALGKAVGWAEGLVIALTDSKTSADEFAVSLASLDIDPESFMGRTLEDLKLLAATKWTTTITPVIATTEAGDVNNPFGVVTQEVDALLMPLLEEVPTDPFGYVTQDVVPELKPPITGPKLPPIDAEVKPVIPDTLQLKPLKVPIEPNFTPLLESSTTINFPLANWTITWSTEGMMRDLQWQLNNWNGQLTFDAEGKIIEVTPAASLGTVTIDTIAKFVSYTTPAGKTFTLPLKFDFSGLQTAWDEGISNWRATMALSAGVPVPVEFSWETAWGLVKAELAKEIVNVQLAMPDWVDKLIQALAPKRTIAQPVELNPYAKFEGGLPTVIDPDQAYLAARHAIKEIEGRVAQMPVKLQAALTWMDENLLDPAQLLLRNSWRMPGGGVLGGAPLSVPARIEPKFEGGFWESQAINGQPLSVPATIKAEDIDLSAVGGSSTTAGGKAIIYAKVEAMPSLIPPGEELNQKQTIENPLANFNWHWPELPEFKWPVLPTWTWPEIAMPSWLWPDIPRPNWIGDMSVPRPGWLGELLAWSPIVTVRSGGSPSAPAFNNVGLNAAGTSYWRGGLTWVGERGAELVNLPRGTAIYSAAQSRNMALAGAGVTVNVTANVANDLDVQSLAYRIADVISRRRR